MNDDDLDLEIPDKDYSEKVLENEDAPEADNDCGDSCKL